MWRPFRKQVLATGVLRVTGVTELPSRMQMVVNGVALQPVHVSGIVQVAGEPAQAVSLDAKFGVGSIPVAGAEFPADVVQRDPLRLKVQWTDSAADQLVDAVRQDAAASVVQDLLNTGQATHVAGQRDALGLAIGDPSDYATIIDNVAAGMQTPLRFDIDEGGVRRQVTVGGGGHLSSAEAAELQRTGIAATASVISVTPVAIPQTMLPNAEASLCDLELDVTRADGTTYRASTRAAFISAARRKALGTVGIVIPVRIDRTDESRVAVDSTTYDAQNPGAPDRL